MYKGYIVKVEMLRPHCNADRLQIATFFGNDVVVGLDTQKGDIGIYFPSDGQLSVEYCEANNLVRKKDDSGNNIGGYLDPDKRNIKAIRLRGEKSDGLYMPIESLNYLGVYPEFFNIGDTIDIVNGHEICKKYIPRGNNRGSNNMGGNKTRKRKIPVAPLFMEHADTEQLAYNLGAFKEDDIVEITLKMHGTSQRTAYLPVLKGYKRNILDRILRREGKPIYDWDYISGTRRTVLENFEGGFYGDNAFRQQHHDKFVGKLWKGETVYYEVVGWASQDTPIMGAAKNSKMGKEFVRQYGDMTYFTYGCERGESECYVYRMTMTNEDGEVVEYTPDFMRYRCEQMGVKTVPVFDRFIIPDPVTIMDTFMYCNGEPGNLVKCMAEKYYDGVDPIGKNHVREGVVCRIINRPKFCAYKDKNYSFKILSGIIQESIENSNQEFSDDILSEM